MSADKVLLSGFNQMKTPGKFLDGIVEGCVEETTGKGVKELGQEVGKQITHKSAGVLGTLAGKVQASIPRQFLPKQLYNNGTIVEVVHPDDVPKEIKEKIARAKKNAIVINGGNTIKK